MDIFKLLNSVPMVDMDPASDVEREEGGTVKLERKEINRDSAVGSEKSKKRKTKAVGVKTLMSEGEGPTVASIIAERPSKKAVMDFFRMRIAQLASEDSD
jgi:hypothetical protein